MSSFVSLALVAALTESVWYWMLALELHTALRHTLHINFLFIFRRGLNLSFSCADVAFVTKLVVHVGTGNESFLIIPTTTHELLGVTL